MTRQGLTYRETNPPTKKGQMKYLPKNFRQEQNATPGLF